MYFRRKYISKNMEVEEVQEKVTAKPTIKKEN